MASYKIAIENSTLGPLGATVTDDDIAKAGVDLDLLVASGVVESTTKPKTPEKEA